MFERYTESARKLLFYARYEASEHGSLVIDTDHMLLGLVRVGKDVAHRVLIASGVVPDRVRADIERYRPVVEKTPTAIEIPFSEGTKKILRFAEEEADLLAHGHIGTEHLLLAMVRADDTAAGAMLLRRGLRIETLRQRVREEVASTIL